MTATTTPQRSSTPVRRTGFAQVLRAEWTKFRTVRGWVIGMIIAALVTVGIALLDHSECGGQATPGGAVLAGYGCAAPIGPGGEAVSDSFYFAHRPLAGNGSLTTRVTALTLPGAAGPARLQPWSKAGIIIKASTRPGSAYAAMLVTPGHGVRMQYDYTGDIAGRPGTVSPAAPRWLRLTRSGDTITGYDSADGTHWSTVGTVRLAGLPPTAQAGLFAATPGTTQSRGQSLTGSSSAGALTLATGHFDHVTLSGNSPARGWAGTDVGGGPGNGAPGAGFRQAGGTLTVTGTGDIAPDVGGQVGTPIEQTLTGVFGALIAVIVVAALFITAEYRRGLIRVTFAASPARGRVLAAKAVVIGAVTFVAGLAGGAGAVGFGTALLRSNGNFILPVSALTEVRVVAGTAALLAVTAVLALALGALLRYGAAAVTVLIVAIVLPYLLAVALPVLPVSAAGLAAPGHPGCRLFHRADRPAVRAGRGQLHAQERLLPAAPVGRLRRALRLGRTRLRPGCRPAPAERRMSSLQAEWTKLRTSPGTGWLLLGVAALTAGLGIMADAATTKCPASACLPDPTRTSLIGIDLSQAVVAILAVLVISGEYGTGMIRVTLTAMPRRTAVLAAKAATVTGVVLLAGALAVAGSVLAGRLILPSHGFTFGPDAPVLRAAAGSVLYLALIALLSLGIGTAVRDAAAAMGIVLGLLYLIPIIASTVTDPAWHRHLEQLAPMTAGLTIQDTTGLRGLPLSPWAGLGVLAAWAAGALLLGGLLLRLRDA